jgi:hypothetical protein
MKRAIVVAGIVALGFTLPAYADVTLKQTTTGKGMGTSGTTQTTTYIKGNKMRTDTLLGDRTQSVIFDLDTQRMSAFDSRKEEADVYEMAALVKEVSASIDTANMKVSFKPNGQTKDMAGKTAIGYDIEIAMPMSIGGNKDMTVEMTLFGPAWVVKSAPGTQDFVAFYKAAAEKGWIFSDPRIAKAPPGQAKAMAEMYKLLAETNGIPYEHDMQMKMGGASGPLAGLFAKMGNVSFATKVDSVDTGALADDLFAPPAGYKLNTRK